MFYSVYCLVLMRWSHLAGVQKVRLVTPISVADCEMDPCSRRNPGSYGSYPNLRREPVQHSWSGSSGGSTMPRASERMSIDVNSNVFEGNDVQSPPSSGTSSSPWKSPFTKIFKRGKSKDPIPKPLVADVRKSADEVLIQRAPPPVPKDERANSTGGSGSSGGSEGVYDRGLYSRIDQRTDKSSMLADALRQHDPTTTCECGLELEDSELPRSWSVHISREPSTTGRIFFEGPQGQTCWNLPLDVSTELSLKQQEFIRKLLLDVRAGKLPPAPNLQGEAASVDSAGKTSIGAFNNSRSSSSSEGSGGMVARGVSPPGSRRSSSQRGYSGGADPATSDGRGAEGAVSTGDSPSYLTRQGNATMRPTNTSL